VTSTAYNTTFLSWMQTVKCSWERFVLQMKIQVSHLFGAGIGEHLLDIWLDYGPRVALPQWLN
jgi:hypothetical protein